MGYPECADKLMEILTEVPGLSEQNVARGQYKILGMGNQVNVVLMQGRIPVHEKFDNTRYRTVWIINIELFIGFAIDRLQVEANMEDYRQAIIDELDKHPTLDSTAGVVFACMTEADEPSYADSASKMWWKQTLVFEIEERQTVTYDAGG
jgi:hypothetical protein